MNTQEQNKIPQSEVKSVYEKPAIEVIEMEHEGSILAGSSDNFGSGNGYDGWN